VRGLAPAAKVEQHLQQVSVIHNPVAVHIHATEIAARIAEREQYGEQVSIVDATVARHIAVMRDAAVGWITPIRALRVRQGDGVDTTCRGAARPAVHTRGAFRTVRTANCDEGRVVPDEPPAAAQCVAVVATNRQIVDACWTTAQAAGRVIDRGEGAARIIVEGHAFTRRIEQPELGVETCAPNRRGGKRCWVGQVDGVHVHIIIAHDAIDHRERATRRGLGGLWQVTRVPHLQQHPQRAVRTAPAELVVRRAVVELHRDGVVAEGGAVRDGVVELGDARAVGKSQADIASIDIEVNGRACDAGVRVGAGQGRAERDRCPTLTCHIGAAERAAYLAQGNLVGGGHPCVGAGMLASQPDRAVIAAIQVGARVVAPAIGSGACTRDPAAEAQPNTAADTGIAFQPRVDREGHIVGGCPHPRWRC